MGRHTADAGQSRVAPLVRRSADMPKPLAAILEGIRQSLWVVPSLAIVVALVGAEIAVWLSAHVTLVWIPFVFSGGPDAAQALLQAIAGSVITVAGVTFSITIIALQLTSSQFSPRVLRNFIRDRASQSVFAAFLATFVYTLVVLGSVKTGTDGQEPYVPLLAVAGALVLTLMSIGMLAFFIHRVAHTIQVSEITRSISTETLDTLRREWADTPRPTAERPPNDLDEVVFGARQGGYLVYTAHEPLVRLAREANAVIRLHAAPGQWTSVGRPLLSVSPPEACDRLSKDPRDHVKLGPQPTLQQDVSFGFRQLVDVALKALSPSLNDPSTAVNCLHRLTELLLEAGRRSEPPTTHSDDAGVVRLLTPQHDFDDLVGLAFDQIRTFGGERIYVALALVEALRELVDDLPQERHGPIRREVNRVADAARVIEIEEDQRTISRALDDLRSAW